MLSQTMALATLLVSADAFACGGFFCDPRPPEDVPGSASVVVNQAGEEILFVIDEEQGKVEVQVRIAFAGKAEDFAWILPVPAVPEIEVTVPDVLDRLAGATNPSWTYTYEVDGTCRTLDTFGAGADFGSVADTFGASDDTGGGRGGGVKVVLEGAVGPYDYKVLQADDAERLWTWLTNNAYTIPESAAPKLAPYVADGSFFVALKLTKGKDAGDLRPLAFTYDGTEPVIPLQLTAIAATDDMPLQPYILGAHRAVPENYYHVRINPFAIDWMKGGANYMDVVTAAADLAGGQAFATDSAGPTRPLRGLFGSPRDFRLTPLRDLGATASVEQVLSAMAQGGFPLSDGTIPILDAHVDLSGAGADDTGGGTRGTWDTVTTPPDPSDSADVYARPWRYDLSQVPAIDVEALASALQEGFVAPMRHAQNLIARHPYLTRLTSTASPGEMTVDPRFVLNDTMGEVAAGRTATLTSYCGDRDFFATDAPMALELPDGRSLWLPGWSEARADDFDWAAWVGPEAGAPAELIEQTGRSGDPSTLQDFRGTIDGALAASRDEAYDAAGGEPVTGGCGCDQGGGSWAWLLGLGALGLRRRRAGA